MFHGLFPSKYTRPFFVLPDPFRVVNHRHNGKLKYDEERGRGTYCNILILFHNNKGIYSFPFQRTISSHIL